MQELNEKLNKINNIRKEIKNTINEKGGELTDTTPFEEYPTAIKNLKSGGGETVMAYYNGTDIEAGKKVLLTRTNNAMATNDTFMNGNIPLLINNGLAYCGDSSNSTAIKTVRNIIDGTISDEYVSIVNRGYWANPALIVNGKDYSSSIANLYIGFTWVHSMAGGKSMLQTFSATDRLNANYHINAYTLLTDNILQSGGYKQNSSGASNAGSYRLSCTENYVVWRDRYIVKAGEGLDTKQNALSAANDLGSNSGCFCFERENEGGRYLYAICYISATSWYFRKYDHETKTVLDSRNGEIDVPYYDFSVNSNGYGERGVYVQTKDYKYLLGAEFYLHLDATQMLLDEPTGIVAKKYPEAITSVLGDRFIGAVQTFYDNTFALTLSDGATLMCRYDGTIPPQALMDNDLLAHCCEVEEIAPLSKPDDTNIYYRHFSGDKAYWFTSVSRNYNKSESFIGSEAHPYQADEFVNSYLAIDYNKERFNSTILTGFMTGNTADDNGRTLVEVATTTGVS